MQSKGSVVRQTADSRVEGVSVHSARGVLELPQVDGALSESRVRLVQAGAPDGLWNATQRSTKQHRVSEP